MITFVVIDLVAMDAHAIFDPIHVVWFLSREHLVVHDIGSVIVSVEDMLASFAQISFKSQNVPRM